MLCVLQIKGTSLDSGLAKQLAVPFYRKDVSDDGHELIFYDVADALSSHEALMQIKRFIAQNRAGLSYALQCPQEVETMSLDIGLLVDEALSRSIVLDRELVAMLGELGISISISAYQSNNRVQR